MLLESAPSALAALLRRLCVGLDERANEAHVVQKLAHDERAGPVVVRPITSQQGPQGARGGVVPTSRALPQVQPFFTVSSISAPARSLTASAIRVAIAGTRSKSGCSSATPGCTQVTCASSRKQAPRTRPLANFSW